MKSKPLLEARITGLASVALATIISLCGYTAAQATPITYMFSGVGTGGLGANPFTNASFTITSTADTSQITIPGGFFHVPDLTATIFVSGIGSGTFNIPTINVDNQGLPGVGFSDPGQNLAILFVDNVAFATYDLSTSIGSLSGPPIISPRQRFGTTAGNFSLTSVSTVTFQATTVPEPATISLFALAGLACVTWRKRSEESLPTRK
jgi:hypothetical protein